MEDKISINVVKGDRYECISQFIRGFTKNKIYDVLDIGKYVWFWNDLKLTSHFDLITFHKNFKLIEKAKK